MTREGHTGIPTNNGRLFDMLQETWCDYSLCASNVLNR
ncbi:MAG: hypothetical protein L3J75_09805 [Methylococcaceae bacterium]|nr:hypothetical protein [Methylococcaceae bacterium]